MVPGLRERKVFVVWKGGGSNLKERRSELPLKYGLPKRNILPTSEHTENEDVVSGEDCVPALIFVEEFYFGIQRDDDILLPIIRLLKLYCPSNKAFIE
jgi:hypothetical protein